MNSYILPLGFTQLRSTNRAVCSDPDLEFLQGISCSDRGGDGVIWDSPVQTVIWSQLRSRRWWRFMARWRHLNSCTFVFPFTALFIPLQGCGSRRRFYPGFPMRPLTLHTLKQLRRPWYACLIVGPPVRVRGANTVFFLNLRLVSPIPPPPQSLGRYPLPPIFNILVSRGGSRTAETFI